MAVLTSAQLQYVRNRLESGGFAGAYLKAQINAALQAIEDAMTVTLIPAGAVGQTMPAYLSGVINAATTPLVLSAAQKKALFALWSELKFRADF